MLRLGLHGDVGVGVFPEREEILVGIAEAESDCRCAWIVLHEPGALFDCLGRACSDVPFRYIDRFDPGRL